MLQRARRREAVHIFIDFAGDAWLGVYEDIAGGASPDAYHPSFRRESAAEGNDTWF